MVRSWARICIRSLIAIVAKKIVVVVDVIVVVIVVSGASSGIGSGAALLISLLLMSLLLLLLLLLLFQVPAQVSAPERHSSWPLQAVSLPYMAEIRKILRR